MLGLAYEICPSEIDEKAIRDSNSVIVTGKRAEAKARKVASEYPDAVVISGDAGVSKGNRIYEKPRTMEEAAQFLRGLSGRKVAFVTAPAGVSSLTGREHAVDRGNVGYLVSSVGGARD